MQEGGLLKRLALCAAWLLICWTSPAEASVFELFGGGPRANGLVGALTASARGGEAAFHNPAMLLTSPLGGAWFGMSLTRVDLHVGLTKPYCKGAPVSCAQQFPGGSSTRQPAMPADSSAFELGWNYPVGGILRRRLALGAGLALPVGHLIRISGPDPQTPNFFQYEGMPDRLAFLFGAALQVADGLWLGAGAQVLAVLNAAIDLRVQPTNHDYDRATIRIGLEPRARLTAGGAWHPHPQLWFGLSYRQQLSLEYAIPTDVQLGDPAQLFINLGHNTLFSPDTIQAGAAWRSASGRLQLMADLGWARWSAAPDPSPYVSLDATGPAVAGFGLQDILDIGTDTPQIRLGLRNTWSPALAAEWRASPAWLLRGGYRYRPTPAPRASGPFNYLDSDTHVLGAGLSWRFGSFAERLSRQLAQADIDDRDTPGPLHIDAGFQWHLQSHRVALKTDRYDPVGDLEHGGQVWHAGLAFGGSF